MSTYTDTVGGWSGGYRVAAIIAVIIAVVGAFVGGGLFTGQRVTELGTGLPIQYGKLPAGNYTIDLVVNQHEGLIVATQKTSFADRLFFSPMQYFVRDVPSEVCVKGTTFTFFDKAPETPK